MWHDNMVQSCELLNLVHQILEFDHSNKSFEAKLTFDGVDEIVH